MTFDDICINENIKRRLTEAAEKGNVSHAYIFEGSACIDKETIALCFVKAILCEQQCGRGCDTCLTCIKLNHGNYEDLILIGADGNSIKDEAIENMQERLRNKPFGARNIVIMSDADTMTLRAQNRLLKTLEEPTPGTVMILLSENAENLTDTIRSRCILYRFSYEVNESDESMCLLAQQLSVLLLKGSPFYLLSQKVKPVTEDKGSALAFLDALETEYGRLLRESVTNVAGGVGNAVAGDAETVYSDESFAESPAALYRRHIFDAIAAIEEARRNLQRNMGVGYALKCMMLKIGG